MLKFLVNYKNKQSKKRAFTLIELVIVIVILGVLAGVAALSFTNVTQSSKNGVAKANLRALKSAAQVYQADNGGKLPPSLFTLKNYLDADLQKATGLDKITTDTAPEAVNGYKYSLVKGTDYIELKCESTDTPKSLTGTVGANDGSYYKLTGTVE